MKKIQNIDELSVIFDAIDSQAEKRRWKKEKEYHENLTPEQKIEYKRLQKRNKNLKRLGMYGLTVAGMATGFGIPVLMAANMGTILSDDSLTFDKEKHDEKLNASKKIRKRSKGQKSKRKT